jgi:hypothetical protein
MLIQKGLRVSVIGFVCLFFLVVGSPSASAAEKSVYDIKVKELTVADCAGCHISHFTRIKNQGGKHSAVVCSECHQVFHAYNPLKNNYAEIMPKCSSCHDAPHGTAEAVVKCLACHKDPHQPLASIPTPDTLEPLCRNCHAPIAALLKEQPSLHTEQECSSCHSEKHGRIPACAECHDAPHGTAEAVMNCASCHQNPHQPLASIPVPATLEGLCRECHGKVAASLTEAPSLHTEQECSSCHSEKHGRIPACAECHDAPHGTAPAVMECSNCHQNPHQPLASIPVPAKLEGQCRGCHSPIAALLKEKPSRHTEQECSSCHSEKHGRIPECAECHENHSPAVQMATPDCLACHPVHTPLQIEYPLTQNKEVCGGCHTDPYDQLAAKQTKHSALTCAKCHPAHGQLMACQDCHGKPHSSLIHNKYKECGACHKIAHDLEK